MKRVLLACLFCGVLAVSTGCCGLCRRASVCDPMLGCAAPCGPASCCESGPVCGWGWGRACGWGCGLGCGSAGVDECGTACDPCCEPSCDYCCHPRGVLFWLRRILHPRFWGCGCAGCGELYWSDFYNEPPDCCDPCDRCGNWTGRCHGGECYSDCGAEQFETPFLARSRARSADRGLASQAGGYRPGNAAGEPSSPYAPRILSVTDRAVGPATTESAPVQRTAAAKPRRAPPRQ